MSIMLRDGSEVEDRRLDRIKQFNPQSQNYQMRGILNAEQLRTPRSYTWPLRVWLDQGQEGACVAFGFNHELAAVPVVVKGRTNEIARSDYCAIQRSDQWDGNAAICGGNGPFYDGTSVQAGVEYFQKQGHYKSYVWEYSDEAVVASTVAWKGPVPIGVNWHRDMMEPDSSGRLNPTGDVVGGHCTLLLGLSLKEDAYILHNSWGPNWGRNGRALLPRKAMAQLLEEEGEAVFPVRKVVVLPT